MAPDAPGSGDSGVEHNGKTKATDGDESTIDAKELSKREAPVDEKPRAKASGTPNEAGREFPPPTGHEAAVSAGPRPDLDQLEAQSQKAVVSPTDSPTVMPLPAQADTTTVQSTTASATAPETAKVRTTDSTVAHRPAQSSTDIHAEAPDPATSSPTEQGLVPLRGGEVRKTAETIADGHAWDKHVVRDQQFPEVTSKGEFADVIERTIETSDISKPIANNGSLYFSRETQTVVLVDPGAKDLGTAFRPRNPEEYANNKR